MVNHTKDTSLYDQDYQAWLEQTADQLAQSQWSKIDLPNLIEEIRDMGKSQRQALGSNLIVILLHLLKYKYQPTHRSNSWLATIVEHRLRVKRQLIESPSLKPYLVTIFNDCYEDGRVRSQVETGLPIDTFPLDSPFTIEEVLNIDYLPNAGG